MSGIEPHIAHPEAFCLQMTVQSSKAAKAGNELREFPMIQRTWDAMVISFGGRHKEEKTYWRPGAGNGNASVANTLHAEKPACASVSDEPMPYSAHD